MKEILDKIHGWLKNDGVLPWLAIVACFYIFWPVGIIATLFKLDVLKPDIFFSHKANVGAKTAKPTTSEQRKAEYKRISKDMVSVSVDYLAKSVGVEFTVAMRDIQEMVIEGAFGSEAYIDYGLRRLIIKAEAFEKAMGDIGKKPQEAVPKPKTNAVNNNKNTNQKKKTNIDQEIGLLICGIILCAIGAIGIFGVVDSIALNWGAVTLSLIWKLISFLGIAGAGGILLGVRSNRKKRARRFGRYTTVIGDRSYISIAELSRIMGIKESAVKKDIEIMLEKGILSDKAYLDVGAGRLVIHNIVEDPVAEEKQKPVDRYHAIIMEIRQLNDEIDDKVVSDKIDQIELLTAKIFKVVQNKPEKLPEIKSFMSYYLPTTLKLLRSYRDFEKQGVGGANIDATKERIEKILDTLINGYRQQLDQLFKSDAMDISSDIDVLETMMRRDGLSKDDSGFQVQI